LPAPDAGEDPETNPCQAAGQEGCQQGRTERHFRVTEHFAEFLGFDSADRRNDLGCHRLKPGRIVLVQLAFAPTGIQDECSRGQAEGM